MISDRIQLAVSFVFKSSKTNDRLYEWCVCRWSSAVHLIRVDFIRDMIDSLIHSSRQSSNDFQSCLQVLPFSARIRTNFAKALPNWVAKTRPKLGVLSPLCKRCLLQSCLEVLQVGSAFAFVQKQSPQKLDPSWECFWFKPELGVLCKNQTQVGSVLADFVFALVFADFVFAQRRGQLGFLRTLFLISSAFFLNPIDIYSFEQISLQVIGVLLDMTRVDIIKS